MLGDVTACLEDAGSWLFLVPVAASLKNLLYISLWGMSFHVCLGVFYSRQHVERCE